MRLGLGHGLDVGYRSELFGVPLLDTYSGAAAAYSLRKLRSGVTSVVRVRRSSDNAEADFTAAEVSDGTMLSWVNTEVVKYSSDFSSTEDLTEINGTGAGNIDGIGGVDDVYRHTVSGGLAVHQSRTSTGPEIGQQCNISFDYYIPSTNAVLNSIAVSDSSALNNLQTNVDSWTSVSLNITAIIGGTIRFIASDGATITINADGDVFYLKNIVVTQTTADGHVVTWYDQSGNGNDATQATAANQPKIVDAGVLVEENGNPAILPDGVDDLLTNINTITYQSIFAVGKPATNVNNNVLLNIGLYFGWQPDEVIYRSNAPDPHSFPSDNTQGLISVIAEGASDPRSVNAYRDGVASTSNPRSLNVGQSIAINIFGRTIGEYDSPIQEIIIYDSDQSANRTAIEQNINEHYNIYP